MLTIINDKIKGVVKSKFIGKTLQYTEFEYNNRNVIFINIHLSSEKRKKKRMKEIKEIYDFVKDKDISILAGDFNTTPSGEVCKFLKKKGYKSVMENIYGKDLNTFPSKKPTRCIDYIWVKGENIDITFHV